MKHLISASEAVIVVFMRIPYTIVTRSDALHTITMTS